MAGLSPGSGTNTNATAIQQASAMASNGVIFGTGLCLKFVRSVLGFASDPVTASNGSSPTAADAWNQVPQAERYGGTQPPAGVPVYWTGGSSGAGHVALSAGGGQVYSTDFGPGGYVGDGRVRLTSIATINQDQGLHYQGWSPYLGDTSASSGDYSSYGSAGTGDAPGTDTSTTSGGGTSILGISLPGASTVKGWVDRLGWFIFGGILLLMVLWKLGGS